MELNQFQVSFFQRIKNMLPPHLGLAEQIGELLSISPDSAYRRIRGEKMLSFEEIRILCNHFHLSIDQLLHLQNDAFIFNGRITNNSDFTFENWLETDISHLNLIRKFPSCHLYYVAKEIPFFYYFLLPEIAAFKSFFFMNSILYYESLKGKRFSLCEDYSRYIDLGKSMYDAYTLIPTTEIWSAENFTSTLLQIEFYSSSGLFKSQDDVHCLYTKIDELIDHLELQAESGEKFRLGEKPGSGGAPAKMFVNELIVGDNMILAEMGQMQVTYLNHSIINFITTQDVNFNAYMKRTLDVITQKSSQISTVNEKDRVIFFNRLRSKVQQSRGNTRMHS